MHQIIPLTILPFLLPALAAPARRSCAVKSSTSSSPGEGDTPGAIAAFAENASSLNSAENTVLAPIKSSAGPTIPSIEVTALSASNKGNIAAYDRGVWSSWGRPKSTTAPVPPATAALPASQPPVAPPMSAPPSPPASSPPAVAVPPGSSSPAAVAPPVSAAPPASASVSAPAASAPPTSSGAGGAGAGIGSGGQAGLGLDNTAYQQLTAVQNLGWYWNWGVDPFPGMQTEFVACVWGEEMANSFAGPAGGVQYIMSFNEPDMGADVGGSNIKDTAHAAALHQQWTAKVTGNVKIGSPAVARGGDKTWFSQWVTACAGNCKYDFVPIHFYGTVVEDLFTYIKGFPTDGKPIWVTEFDCQDFSTGEVCDAAKQEAFMDTAVAWFKGEGAAYVERWAWFGALPKFSTMTYGLENADGTLNDLGQHYLSL
ncbi:uncharacterized protein I303_107114 [Kwoniella dejecticola CBS 10117]|uniref:Asl1-like glycosyl hydrolase catalytic domain-containing protein n=1 Tax=Kwoniella dejecticola CBS 10117 TaxID=1296121 RepID=A0A1A5ZYS7_9TREE|nr:uncharacterized protein I303_06516 [Kwoniella dejecticola CBS 10117]OBR82958.1 hypothetical protein I303_06516 [Kwoniella dejecticola CBS 10117]